MSEDLPDFLSDEPSSAPIEPAVEAAPLEAPAAPEAEAPVAPVEQPQAEPPLAAEEPPAPQHVPLTTFLDMRDKYSAANKKAAELEQWRQQQEAQARRQPAPDPFDDPAGALAHRDQSVAEQFRNLRLDNSERFATLKHGEDVVKAAQDWYDKEGSRDRFLDQKVEASKDPFGTVVEEWKRSQLLSKISPDQLDAFQQWQASQTANPVPGIPVIAPAANQPPARPQAPRASIAAGPSAGGAGQPVPLDGEGTFNDMFAPK